MHHILYSKDIFSFVFCYISAARFQSGPLLQVANCLLWWWEVQLDEMENLSNRSGTCCDLGVLMSTLW